MATKIKTTGRELKWKADLPQLFKEILEFNDSMWIMKNPLMIVKQILSEVAGRAIELNDPILNELMCDLKLYELPSPASDEYKEVITQVRKSADEQRKKEGKI